MASRGSLLPLCSCRLDYVQPVFTLDRSIALLHYPSWCSHYSTDYMGRHCGSNKGPSHHC